MKNQLEPADIEWRYIKHITLATQSHFLYRDNRFGIQWEQITNRDGHGFNGKGKNYFFIDEVEREFTDLQTLCDCWNERNNYDDPNSEITWVKVIRTKERS